MIMAENLLRIYQFLPVTRVEGPGIRAGVWVQGCPIHCDGCAVPQTWDFSGGTLMEAEALAERILAVPELEGVTFAGGEPFAQAASLAVLGGILQQHHKSVITFTGYTLRYLEEAAAGCQRLLEVTDLLIAGPYDKRYNSDKMYLAGSENQQYHFLTSRYAYLQAEIHQRPNKIEIHILPDGRTIVNGMMPGAEFYKLLQL